MSPSRFVLMVVAAGAVWYLCAGGTHLAAVTGAQDSGDGNTANDAVRTGILARRPLPRTTRAVRDRLRQFGGTLRSHIVANGGHGHPLPRGVMFMSFETYEGPSPGGDVAEGELLIGYFLVRNGTRLSMGDGFVELIAWDRTKRRFNFWELTDSEWMYRGDSDDVRANVATLNMGNADAAFTFTKKAQDGTDVLRCSGCHTLGAPVMKELEAPHNDWWRTDRHLPLGSFEPDAAVAKLLAGATDAANLAVQVKRGIDRLVREQTSPEQPLAERLRSLVSTMEMNLASDTKPFPARVADGSPVEVPSSFFVDARLIAQNRPVPVDIGAYGRALERVDSRFPANGSPASRETHHAFLVPVRSYIDNRVLDLLIEQGVLDQELIADVLAVDMTRPVYSEVRASLIRFFPSTAANAGELRTKLVEALRVAPAHDRAAQALLANLTDPERTVEAHRRNAHAYLEACRKAAARPEVVEGWLRHAQGVRGAITQAQTAMHPEGDITEAGFRDVFPRQLRTPAASLAIDPTSCAAAPRQ